MILLQLKSHLSTDANLNNFAAEFSMMPIQHDHMDAIMTHLKTAKDFYSKIFYNVN